jgi:hypothetical protein
MRVFSPLGLVVALAACGTSSALRPAGPAPIAFPAASSEVILTSSAAWQDPNPARGDKSPRAATLWGDRKGQEATGFLLRPVDGFSSPPHLHNVTYRAVVIRGLIHNDDPKAAEMWMPAGSFWTQPKGEVHITSAKGKNILAYVEIDKGPYLVLPVAKAFDSRERPINVDASNVVWVDQPGLPSSAQGAKVAFLWGDPKDSKPSGAFVKLPAGFSGFLRSHGASLRAVVIQGQPTVHVAGKTGKTGVKALEPGSYVSWKGRAMQRVSCAAGGECVVYLRVEGKFDVVSTGR